MKKVKTKVSVVIPSYNRPHFLLRAINSVLRQTFTSFELIIVDDASTEDIATVITSINDSRVVFVKHNCNKGVNIARNTGLKISRGEYIAFLDNDDEWLPEKLERQLASFEQSKDERLGVVGCQSLYIYEFKNKKLIYKSKLLKKEGAPKGLFKNEFSADGGSCYLIKREVFENVGYFDESEELDKGGQEDYEMWLRINRAYRFSYLPQVLLKRYFYSTTRSSFVGTEDKAKAIIYIFNKHEDEYKDFPKIYSGKLRYLGCQYCLLGDIKRGRRIFILAFKQYPKNILSIQYFFTSLFGFNFFKLVYRFKVALQRFDTKRKFYVTKINCS